MKENIILLLLFWQIFSFAQTDETKLEYEPKDKTSLVELLENLYENQKDAISNSKRKQVKKIYKERHELVVKMLDDSIFIFNKNQQEYLNSILNHIYTSNPIIDSKDFTFLINRSAVPNAACFGDKTFMVNLGLIDLLDNEDQYAFILCHEIAHYQLNHANKSINDRIDILNSKEVLKEAREIKNRRYGRNTRGLSFLKDLTFDFLKHNRKAEIEADSLGFLLFKNTKYSQIESKKALNLLGDLDDFIFHDSIQLKEILTSEGYPFKEYWLNKEQSLFSIDEKVDDFEWDKDSLKTHPDIELRVAKLKAFNLEDKNSEVSNFKEMKTIAKKQLVNSLIDHHQLDLALYFSLNEIQKEKSPYYYTKTAHIFLEMYELRKTHKLGKYVPTVSPITKEKNINEVRQFIHNLELKNMRKIGYNFCLKHQDKLKEDEEFMQLFEKFKEIN